VCAFAYLYKKKKKSLAKNCELAYGTQKQHCQEDMVKLVGMYHSVTFAKLNFYKSSWESE